MKAFFNNHPAFSNQLSFSESSSCRYKLCKCVKMKRGLDGAFAISSDFYDCMLKMRQQQRRKTKTSVIRRRRDRPSNEITSAFHSPEVLYLVWRSHSSRCCHEQDILDLDEIQLDSNPFCFSFYSMKEPCWKKCVFLYRRSFFFCFFCQHKTSSYRNSFIFRKQQLN